MPGEHGFSDAIVDAVNAGVDLRSKAIEACILPIQAQAIVDHLFPRTHPGKGIAVALSVEDAQGHLASPVRLAVALRMSIGSAEVSLRQVRAFLTEPVARAEIGASIDPRGALEFLERLGEMARLQGADEVQDPIELAVAMARLTETPAFVARASARGMLTPNLGQTTEEVIGAVMHVAGKDREAVAARAIVEASGTLTLGMRLVAMNYFPEAENVRAGLALDSADQARLCDAIGQHVIASPRSESLWGCFDPSTILRSLTFVAREACPAVYDAIAGSASRLDQFACALLWHSVSSEKGMDSIKKRCGSFSAKAAAAMGAILESQAAPECSRRLGRALGWVVFMLIGFAGLTHASETATYYYTDQQGTVLATADSAGSILTTADYRPYGAVARGAPEEGPGYTGHVDDTDTGVVYMQARYYDPAVGRFLSVDWGCPWRRERDWL
ncbi:RHS repeat-associated core domain-containing protein [Luteibacter aegosomatis]|uniref:RHS repeat domain-containing protein n=1 Tax=Luteibacter aegosomatis TaxID=2911537 RepID=UPI001FF703EB|nr:RHS repeat-associated core domain-containing protein [Luteibacter aegosomatis]UPG87458.1 RHS repeat-associated core domain-containing protein [Luteibacter aegosomatis]